MKTPKKSNKKFKELYLIIPKKLTLNTLLSFTKNALENHIPF